MRIVFRCDPALYDRLARPVAARGALPEWLRNMPASAFSELHRQQIRTVKQCPPFVDAMAHGFIIPLPCDVIVRRRQIFLVVGFTAACGRSTSALTVELSCACASYGNAVSRSCVRRD